MGRHQFLCLLFTLSTICVGISSNSHTSPRNLTKIVMKLIHPHLVNPPSYLSPLRMDGQWEIYGPLSPISNAFFVNISVGTPPIPQLVRMDTGSSLLWIPCQPCDNCKTVWGDPTFDMRSSETFIDSKCNEGYCQPDSCDPNNRCVFDITDADETNARGVIGFETITFPPASNEAAYSGTEEVDDVLFGCATKSNKPMDGVFGLADNHQMSIHQSTGKQFSYCFGSIIDPTYPYNRLVLGEGADLLGDYVPYYGGDDGHYSVSLLGITYGNTNILNKAYSSNFIIDSGSTNTYIDRTSFDALKSAVGARMEKDYNFKPLEAGEDPLCYRGELGTLKKFTPVTLHFSKGIEISLTRERLFVRYRDGVFCMAILPDDHGVYRLGLVAQQYLNVGFDLAMKRVYLHSTSCGILN